MTAFKLIEELIRSRGVSPFRFTPCDSLAWQEAYAALSEHRLQFFVADALLAAESRLPTEQRDVLLREHFSSKSNESLLTLALLRFAARFQSQNIDLLVCKGAILASDYYPRRGTRPMQDLDVWVHADALEASASILRELGFVENTGARTHSALNFENSMGVVVDLHHQMALFPGETMWKLSEPHATFPFRVFVPEALLVHLVVHALGHAPKVGILLAWVMDMALVVERHKESLDFVKIEALCPDEDVYLALLRILRWAETVGLCELPRHLAVRSERLKPLNLETLIALRRWAHHRLDTPRGWLKMGRGTEDEGPRALRLAEVKRARELWRAEQWREAESATGRLLRSGTLVEHD